MEKVPMTRRGYDALNAELKELKETTRPAVIKAIAEAREHGDLSENAEYHSAKEKQSFIEGRIKELEGVLGLAEVIDRVDAILAPWGGTGAHDRETQVSHSFIQAELNQLRSMSAVLPPILQ